MKYNYLSEIFLRPFYVCRKGENENINEETRKCLPIYYPKHTRPHWDRRNEKEGKGKKKGRRKKKEGREGGSEKGRKREKYQKGKSTLFLYQP